MLQFSKVLLYAVHALYHIGYEITDRPVMAREISKRYSFSYDATLRVLQSLSRNGILVSHRGATGGFTLSRKVESVNLLDVVEALEGRHQSVDPLPIEMGDTRLKRSTGLVVKGANRCFTKQLRTISIVSLFNQGKPN
ncbi:MAG: Rrf2 family transcriptional regulator [candidate division Zixibacteria bacterium]|nr:Rrf2 family transcriptional regulator [candidate division Zixibacteria bacterium]